MNGRYPQLHRLHPHHPLLISLSSMYAPPTLPFYLYIQAVSLLPPFFVFIFHCTGIPLTPINLFFSDLLLSYRLYSTCLLSFLLFSTFHFISFLLLIFLSPSILFFPLISSHLILSSPALFLSSAHLTSHLSSLLLSFPSDRMCAVCASLLTVCKRPHAVVTVSRSGLLVSTPVSEHVQPDTECQSLLPLGGDTSSLGPRMGNFKYVMA